MLIVSDVHGAFAELARVGRTHQPLLVLGDLINFVDYRTGEGIAAEVYGRQFVVEFTRNRRRGDWSANRRLWRRVQKGRVKEIRKRIRSEVRSQYQETRRALIREERTYLIPGNVDWPKVMTEELSDVVVMADGQVVEIEGYSVGFAGGGVPTPAHAQGEITHEVMAEKLAGLGTVDILCTHVAPSVGPLHRDVVTGRPERSSQVVLDYLLTHRPRFHYFGDIHQPQATTWRVGRTLCRNVGYFRATARAVQH